MEEGVGVGFDGHSRFANDLTNPKHCFAAVAVVLAFAFAFASALTFPNAGEAAGGAEEEAREDDGGAEGGKGRQEGGRQAVPPHGGGEGGHLRRLRGPPAATGMYRIYAFVGAPTNRVLKPLASRVWVAFV